MQIEITTRHGHIRDDDRAVLEKKAEKLLTYFERVTAIHITMDFDHDKVKAEILVDAEHKHNFVASSEGDEVVSTFEKTLHKMEQQVRKYKEKLQDHRRDRPTNEVVRSEVEDQ